MLSFLAILVCDDILVVFYEHFIAVGIVPGGGIISRLDLRYLFIAVVARFPFNLVDGVEADHEKKS